MNQNPPSAPRKKPQFVIPPDPSDNNRRGVKATRNACTLSLLIAPKDLAILAAILDPNTCKSNSRAALTAASALFYETVSFSREELLPLSLPIFQELCKNGHRRHARALADAMNEEAFDSDLLKLRPKEKTDDVRKMFSAQPKAIRSNIEKHLLESGRSKKYCSRFLKKAERQDPKTGEKYFEFERDFLEEVLKSKTRRKSAGGKKSSKTRKMMPSTKGRKVPNPKPME